MIPQIKEINFPEYATLSTATASLVDMGDKTITAQVKIDGSIVPDFSYDWEIEFQGERYIQPLREPQASKGNESISSVIDLTFYHKGIYDLKRHFFVSVAETEAGTIMADNYVVPLALDLGEFVDYLNKVLGYYYGSTYKVYLYDSYEYDRTDKKYIDINYTKIWDLLTQVYDIFGVRWSMSQEDENAYFIEIAFPSREVSHIFKYGFDGGLLKFERQVQDAEIRNQMFGRGGSQNLPYRYFKDVDPYNTAWKADPDWIPELALINFSELRGKSFRDYVRGWKAKHYGGRVYLPATDAYTKGYTDEKFDPVDYVEDKDSIAKYGLIQGGLDNNEDIFPTIQKRDLGEGLGRADEVVFAEEILIDEPTSSGKVVTNILEISGANRDTISSVNMPRTLQFASDEYEVPFGHIGYFVKDFNLSAVEGVSTSWKHVRWAEDGTTEVFESGNGSIEHDLDCKVSWVKVINSTTSEEISDITNIPSGTRFRIVAEFEVSNFLKQSFSEEVKNYPYYGQTTTRITTIRDNCVVTSNFEWELNYSQFNGQILGNYTEGANRISSETTIPANGNGRIELRTKVFEIGEDGATNVNVPTRIISSDTTGSYSPRKIVDAINEDTQEAIDPSNLSKGKYRLRIIVDIQNLSTASQTYKVELLPTYIYYPYDSNTWRPTFNIWIKNIWQSTRLESENSTSYAERVWQPILGDKQGNEAKVVFSSGSLSGYSDWEFPIVSYAFDNTKSLNGVQSHWRLTLAKSDAEVDASGKWIPSIQTQAKMGDRFYFIGIDMPHQYVLWAEEEVDKWKRENMPSQIKPTYAVLTDKVRLDEIDEVTLLPLLKLLSIGNHIRVADFRFIKGDYDVLYLQSITYTWDASTTILPNVEVMLSDKVISNKNPFNEAKFEINKISIGLSEVVESKKNDINRFKRINANTSEQALVATTMAKTAETTAKAAQEAANKVSTNMGAYDVVITNINKKISAIETDIGDIDDKIDSVEASVPIIVSNDTTLLEVEVQDVNNVKTATITPKTSTMGFASIVGDEAEVVGLATAEDVYEYVKARLSVKVVK